MLALWESQLALSRFALMATIRTRRMVARLRVIGHRVISLVESSWARDRGSADGAIRMDGMRAPAMRIARVGVIGPDTIGQAGFITGR
jgi:hypothetical protein